MQNVSDARGARLGSARVCSCLLHLALARLCQDAAPVTAPCAAPRPPSARSSAFDRISSTSPARPGVPRGAWGIAVQSLDRRERLFELNPRTLLVPASVAKLVTVATAADAVGWDYPLHDDAPSERSDRGRRASGRPARRRLWRSVDRRARRRRPFGLGRGDSRPRASAGSMDGSSAMTMRLRSRGRSWRGPGTISATRRARCSAR